MSGASSSAVTLSAVNDQLTIVSTATGTAADYPYIIETTAWDQTDFPSSPSFPTIAGNLDGGGAATTGSTTQQVYSFTVPSGGYDPVGNLTSYTDSVMGTWGFGFDTLNRLLTGTPGTGSTYSGQNFCWAYDGFGNRTMQTMQSAACTSGMTPTANYSTINRLTSALYQYDASGDVVSDPQNQYLYDAEGRICAVASTVLGMTTMTGYMYDAEGTRVSKGAISAWSCNPTASGYTTTTDFILGASGEQLSEYTMQPGGSMAWAHTNVWVAGKLIATYSQDSSSTTQKGLLHFYFDDPLGTRRAQTDYAGNSEQTCLSLPFGDGETCAPSPTEHLFTGKERDTESGNDYFKYRYYGSSMGRWMSPDPSRLTHVDLSNPQELNLYSYVGNNPLTRTDLDGLCIKGFQWACNIGQRFGNVFDNGYFKTNSQVDAIAKQGAERLKKNGYSPEGLHRNDLLKVANLGAGAKSFQSYVKRHPLLEPYSGRTSGAGTPEENVQLRDRNHHMNEQGYGEAELDKSSTNPDAIRGREQQLIEGNGGAQSQGGTSGNAINGIAESNPNKGAYMGAANAEFGAGEGAEGTIEIIEILNDLSNIP